MARRPAAVSLEDLPAVLTVEEAADVLRIGRGAAYELARRFRYSGAAEGLPVVCLGRSLRVPKAALQRLVAGNGELLADRESAPTDRHPAA